MSHTPYLKNVFTKNLDTNPRLLFMRKVSHLFCERIIILNQLIEFAEPLRVIHSQI